MVKQEVLQVKFIEVTTNAGRRIMLSANQIVAFAECIDVKGSECRILVSGYDQWLYVRESYEKVGNLIHDILS